MIIDNPTEFIKPYISKSSPKRRENYSEYCYAREQHEWHFCGKFPKKLISRKRPAEEKQILEWREAVYQAVTKAPTSKVFTSLQKIFRSQDWHIGKGEDIPKIKEGKDIFSYLFMNYPKYGSIETWLSRVYLRQYLIDAGGVCIIKPTTWDVIDTEYFTPTASVIPCDDVIDFVDGVYCVVKIDDYKYIYNGKSNEGWAFAIWTDAQYIEVGQISPDEKGKVLFEYAHELNMLPCFEIGAIAVEEEAKYTEYETRVSPMIPDLNDAINIYSDGVAEFVQHVHSTMYSYESTDCKVCNGVGMIPQPKGLAIACTECNGKGSLPLNPFEHVSIRRPNQGDEQLPNPPVGYITKSTEMMTIINQMYSDKIYSALSAINMEFLAQTPLNQSGVAKQTDREETNNFAYSIAEDIVSALIKIGYITSMYRYGKLATSEQIRAMQPKPNIPTKFDIITESVMLDDLTRLSTAKVDPTLIAAAQIEYARKKFNTQPEIAEKIVAKMELDPLAGMGDDSISVALFNKSISQIDAVIHYNITKFVERSVDENPNWVKLSKREKYAILEGYATETINATTTTTQ